MLWVFDTEDNSEGKVYWVNFFNGVEHVSFRDPCRAAEWLLEASGEFWACNLEYDLINLFGPLLDRVAVLTYGGFGLLKASLYKKPVKFLNTLRHWPLSVEEMGQRLGYPKLPFDPTNIDYCRRDCEVTWSFVVAMLQKYRELGMDSIAATLPGTALKFFLSRFCAVEYQRHPDLAVWEFLRESRYGGRCEIYYMRPVHGPVWEYDINSSYPSVMRDEIFPNLETFRAGIKRVRFEREGVARVTVRCPPMPYPVLPWKSPENGKLLFPIGRFTGVWTYPELREALRQGYRIDRVHEAVEYDPMPSPFREYIDYLYQKRMEVKGHDELMSYTIKIAMNATYGKFSEAGALTVLSRGKRYELGQVPKHSNMIWSSYILAYGRLKLYRYMLEAAEKGTLLYVDTDSVFVRCPRAPFGAGSQRLGELAQKGCYQYAHFKLPKLYRVDDRYRAKGIPADRGHTADTDRLKRQYFEQGVAEFSKPYRWLESKKLGELANVWHTTTKRVNATYDKRQVCRDGKTWPIAIDAV
jgi:hypothetical protein